MATNRSKTYQLCFADDKNTDLLLDIEFLSIAGFLVYAVWSMRVHEAFQGYNSLLDSLLLLPFGR